jgi:hypothetical protein
MLLSNLQREYGSFSKEADGRLSGHVLAILGQRKDGKFTCLHCFGSGARIKKIYTNEQLALEIEKVNS